MKVVRYGWLLLGLLVASSAQAAETDLRVELNGAEATQGRCRLSFVIENKADTPVESLKLDLVLFNKDGVVQRRLVAEMGPVRRAKTIVKAFDVEGGCESVGSVLVNDVAACAPAALGDCLDRLALASRVASLRLFK
jgi:hypothetical protein